MVRTRSAAIPPRFWHPIWNLQRGSRIINLSYGRLSLERKRGWAALEWGMELLCRVTGVTVVAAAGQPCEGLMEGRRLHLPASVPEVLAADGEDRWSGCSAVDEEEQEILPAVIPWEGVADLPSQRHASRRGRRRSSAAFPPPDITPNSSVPCFWPRLARTPPVFPRRERWNRPACARFPPLEVSLQAKEPGMSSGPRQRGHRSVWPCAGGRGKRVHGFLRPCIAKFSIYAGDGAG